MPPPVRQARRNPQIRSYCGAVPSPVPRTILWTGHVVYTICRLSMMWRSANNIRPERPMAASSIGAQMGIIASPVSVAVVSGSDAGQRDI